MNHVATFIAFCDRKLAVAGPDIHMKTAGVGTDHVDDPAERLWRLAVYNSFCSTPPAAAIWARWSQLNVARGGVTKLEPWLREHWAGIPVRKNRRPVRSPAKLARCLTSVALWLTAHGHELASYDYETAWRSLDAVFSWGRYVKIKFLETCRRYLPGYEHLEAPDIRANGAWSPRTALGFLTPTHAEPVARPRGTKLIVGGRRNDRATIALVHDLAADLQQVVVGELGRPLSMYELEALLCNYRQTLAGTFYVGRTIDSELEYHRKVSEHFGEDAYGSTFDFFATRRRVFPAVCLGEVQGWPGVRKDLWGVLVNYGYLWSDVLHDYNATTDLATPVVRLEKTA